MTSQSIISCSMRILPRRSRNKQPHESKHSGHQQKQYSKSFNDKNERRRMIKFGISMTPSDTDNSNSDSGVRSSCMNKKEDDNYDDIEESIQVGVLEEDHFTPCDITDEDSRYCSTRNDVNNNTKQADNGNNNNDSKQFVNYSTKHEVLVQGAQLKKEEKERLRRKNKENSYILDFGRHSSNLDTHNCSTNTDIACGSHAIENECLFTVGNVDYLIEHHQDDFYDGDSSSSNSSHIPGQNGSDSSEYDVFQTNKFSNQDGEEKIILNENSIDHVAVSNCKITCLAANQKYKAMLAKEGNKSRMGNFFKKGGGKGGGANSDSTSPRAGGNASNEGGNCNNDQDNPTDRNGDDNENDDNNNGKGSSNNPNGNKDSTGFDPLTYFGQQRVNFALQSTLPLHNGPSSSVPLGHSSWTPITGTQFQVRIGPNYSKNGKKEASLMSLYEVYEVRYFRSAKRTVGGATRIMPLAGMMDSKENGTEAFDERKRNDKREFDESIDDKAKKMSNPELSGTKVPDVLVVHFMLPYEPPNMFKQKDDGAGGECVFYLRPSSRFLDEISGRLPITPASRLFVKWCNECQSDAEFRSRFKCMAMVKDIDRHNFGMLKTYNGKPVLITESGRVYSGFHGDVRYLEMTANVHFWAFIAKKGFVSIIPKFKSMQIEVGFTIEGRADHELPECMLGATMVSYINEETGPIISPEMQEPVHEHQA